MKKISNCLYKLTADADNALEVEPNENIAPSDLPEKVNTVSVDDGGEGDEKKKKKKKNKSKGGKGSGKEQTNPPSIPIAELFPDGKKLTVLKDAHFTLHDYNIQINVQ